jgi:hypothetical protein
MKITLRLTTQPPGDWSGRPRQCRTRRYPKRRDAVVLLAMAGLAALALTAGPGTTTALAAPSPPPARLVHVNPAPKVAPNPADITPADASTCATAAFKAGWPMDNYTNTQEGNYRDIVIAVAIGMAESSCSPDAYNPSAGCDGPALGIWQISENCYPDVSAGCLENGQCNADAAENYAYAENGFCAWQTFDTDCGAGYNASWAGFISDAETAVGEIVITLGNVGTGECVAADASEEQNGGSIWQWSCASNSYNEWFVDQPDGNLNPVLVNAGTGLCLDTEAGEAYDYGAIFQYTCNPTGDPHQRWSVVNNPDPNDNTGAELNLKDSGNGTCLAADASEPEDYGAIWQWDCNGYSTNQYLQWN